MNKKSVSHPIVAKMLNENPAFRAHPLDHTNDDHRSQLPVLSDPVTKIKVWTLLKENIGKDLSKITMPVIYNEPLSMLQKCAENLEYNDLIRTANKTENRYLRLGFVLASSAILYSNTVNRVNKTFNPMLGETYEYFENDLRVIIEQVSHHPPISAFYAESNDFTYEGSFYFKTKLTMTSFEILQLGSSLITLKKTGETFTITQPEVNLHNYIIGAPYLWFKGDMICTNLKTGDRAVLNVKPKGWTSKGDYQCDGFIYDNNDLPIFELFGMWNDYLIAIDPQSRDETVLAKKKPSAKNHEKQYFLTQFAIRLNQLTPKMLEKIAPTDSRLRPDLRAYEYRNLELATREKTRLEEKQRAHRKLMEQNQHTHTPLWFTFSLQNDKAEIKFKGEFFNVREKLAWPKNIPDIFTL